MAVEWLRERFPEYAETIVCGDCTREISWPGPFALIVDRASLTHNPTVAIQQTLECCYDRLSPAGSFSGSTGSLPPTLNSTRASRRRTRRQSAVFVQALLPGWSGSTSQRNRTCGSY
jgi:hypothetical protein